MKFPEINRLAKAANHLESLCLALKNAAVEDKNLPFFLPPSTPGEGSRAHAMLSLTRVWVKEANEVDVIGGLLCISERTAALIPPINEAKLALKEQITAIKDVDMKNMSMKDALMRKFGVKERGEALTSELKRNGLERIDLQKCYSRIRILPSPLITLSWTWARKHTQVTSIDLKTAEALIRRSIKDPDEYAMAIAVLHRNASNARILRKRLNPPQLRCAFVHIENRKQVRSQEYAGSPLLVVQDHLPKALKWREHPGDAESEYVPHSDVNNVAVKINSRTALYFDNKPAKQMSE